MASRYDNVGIGTNNSEQYRKILQEKGVRQLKQYFTPLLHHPSAEETKDLDKIVILWKHGDTYMKLAEEHYKDPTLWWVIAWYNQKPTHFDIQKGDKIYIPVPLEDVLRVLRV